MCAQGSLCDSVCLCNLSLRVARLYLIHHLWGAATFFFLLKSQAYLDQKLFFISLIFFFDLFFSSPVSSSFSSAMSLQDVALVSRGLKPLRVTLLIICQIQGERCLAGCNISSFFFFFLSRFVFFSQPLLGCRCLSSLLLI